MNNQKEVWLPIKGYKGLYEVSNLGRVKSLERFMNNMFGTKSKIKERFLKFNPDGGGYLNCRLYKNGIAKTFKIHKLVAIAFLNHVPNGMSIIVDHIDNDKLNNSLENLQLISNRENLSKDRKGGTSKYVGVSLATGRKTWVAMIRINDKNKNLGYYKTELEASNAYKKELNKINNKNK